MRRLGGQWRYRPDGRVCGIEMSSALALGRAMGIRPGDIAEYLPVIEAAVVNKLAQDTSE